MSSLVVQRMSLLVEMRGKVFVVVRTTDVLSLQVRHWGNREKWLANPP